MYVPTSAEAMQSPSLGKMRPFVLRTATELRPPPPAAVDSAQALRDLDEVRILGGRDSIVRTALQTEVARFHEPPGFLVWNGIARSAIRAKAVDVPTSARVMALLNFALMDAQLVVWDAKFHYNAWRPRTAIAAQDLARAVSAPPWRPLLIEPMHPEYPCAHCGFGSAASTVLQGLFGSGPFAFSARTGALNGELRAYGSFREFEEEERRSPEFTRAFIFGIRLRLAPRWAGKSGKSCSKRSSQGVERRARASAHAAVTRQSHIAQSARRPNCKMICWTGSRRRTLRRAVIFAVKTEPASGEQQRGGQNACAPSPTPSKCLLVTKVPTATERAVYGSNGAQSCGPCADARPGERVPHKDPRTGD
jgi:hypothetical protein